MNKETEETPLLLEEKKENSTSIKSDDKPITIANGKEFKRQNIKAGTKKYLRHSVRDFSKSSSSVSSNPFLHYSQSKKNDIGLAALLIRDAINNTDDVDLMLTDNDFLNPYHEGYSFNLFSRRMLGNFAFEALVTAAVYGLVLLTFYEPPMWCDTIDGNRSNKNCETLFHMKGVPAFVDEMQDTEGDLKYYYPSSRSMHLTSLKSQILESICLLVLVIYLVFKLGREGFYFKRHIFYKVFMRMSRSEVTVFTVQILAVLGLIVGVGLGIYYGIAIPLNPYLRILVFITYSDGIRREIKTVIKLLPEITRIYIIFAVVLLFYAWIGVVAFKFTLEGKESFSDITEASWTLWTCVTTANYPDVMMPAYNQSRFTCIYFISFMIIMFYGFMNVILAVVVQIYHEQDDIIESNVREQKHRKLREAFQILDRDGNMKIDRQEVMNVFPYLNEDCPDIKYINDETAELLFAILDKDGTSQISMDEFMDFCEIMLLEFDLQENYMTFVQRSFPKLYASAYYKKFSAAVKSDYFEIFIDCILILNAVVVGIQSYPELMGKNVEEDPHIADGYIDTPWEVAETIFTVIYCVEMILKILAFGWKNYIQNRRNTFDFTITILTVFATLYVYYPNKFSDSRLIRYIVMCRVLRLFRLVVAIKQFRVIGRTFVGVLPAVHRIFLTLFSLMYIYSVVGVHIFGGMITRDPNSQYSFLLKDTDFSDNHYWANNFNDFLSGMNVLFNLLVINNWPEQASGYEAVTQSKYTRYFFLTFHILGVTIISNLLVATLIDHFIDEYGKNIIKDKKGDHGLDASVTADAQAYFDASEITGTKTNLSGRYVARLKAGSQTTDAQRSKIKLLFTRTSSDNGAHLIGNQTIN